MSRLDPGKVQRYSPAGALLATYRATGTGYTAASVTPTGNIVTVRRLPASGVNVYSPEGAEIASFDTPAVTVAADVSVFADGVLAVNDRDGGAVRLYDLAGGFVRSITALNMGLPLGNAVSPLDGTLWVADGGGGIFHFDEAGTLLSGFGPRLLPGDVLVDPTDGTLWVTDRMADSIVHFTPAGASLGGFGIGLAGAFYGIGISPDGGTLYATTQSASVVNRFTRSGVPLGSFSVADPTLPMFLTVVPRGISAAAPEPADLVLFALAALPTAGLAARRK